MSRVMRDQDFFWDGVDRGVLLAQCCRECGAMRHPPLPACAQCRSMDWEPVALSGRGRIHSWIVSRHPTDPDAAEQLVILVDLEEGIRLVSNLVDGEHVRVGAGVTVEYGDVGGRRLPLFRTTDGAA